MQTYLKPHQRLTFVVLVWRRPGGLTSDNRQFHVFDLQPHEEEVDAADNDILEVVLGFGVFEFNVQAVLDTDIHLDDTVGLWRHTV